MNKLTLKDYIDLEELIKTGVGNFEQQTFLLSRYYELETDHIKDIDIRLINMMMDTMDEYINEKPITQKEVDTEIHKIDDKITKDTKVGKHDRIETRSEILDL